MDDNKKRALAAALGQIERQFGKGAVMRMGDHERQAIPAISTGSLGLDIALGIGGLPKGRIVEIYGPESSGKTTLTLSVIAQAQKMGATVTDEELNQAVANIAQQNNMSLEQLRNRLGSFREWILNHQLKYCSYDYSPNLSLKNNLLNVQISFGIESISSTLCNFLTHA